ncbi:MAG TPA: hypothetical protein VFP14_05595 [Novosphingobium sp.]|nr:hypothetical protein [Novosphingobium sp.]
MVFISTYPSFWLSLTLRRPDYIAEIPSFLAGLRSLAAGDCLFLPFSQTMPRGRYDALKVPGGAAHNCEISVTAVNYAAQTEGPPHRPEMAVQRPCNAPAIELRGT